jgi:hypothetical protein
MRLLHHLHTSEHESTSSWLQWVELRLVPVDGAQICTGPGEEFNIEKGSVVLILPQ